MDKQQRRREWLAKWKSEQAQTSAEPQAAAVVLPAPKARQQKRPLRLQLHDEDSSRQSPVKAPKSKEDVTADSLNINLDDYMNTLIDEPMAGPGSLVDQLSDEEGDKHNQSLTPLEYLHRAERKNKKEIAQIDHSAIEYPNFRKSFYSVPEELIFLPEDLRIMRDSLGISLKTPKDRPEFSPIESWSQTGLPQPMLDVIAEKELRLPTPIQAQIFPYAMSGYDVIGIAPTGSGKTIAFTLPLLRLVLDQSGRELVGPLAIVLSPTRELCMQTYQELSLFTKHLSISAILAAGGTPVKDQIDAVKRGVDIIVATPGRMIDLLAANNGRLTSLKNTMAVVIDEADRMFDIGFEPQVRKIVDNVRPDRLTMVVSATFSSSMEKIVRKILHEPTLVQIGARSTVTQNIHQVVAVIPQEQKFLELLSVLGTYFQDDGQAIVFVDTQERAVEVAQLLQQKGYRCHDLHGGQAQSQRDETLAQFRRGELPLLVATSVAARGLDVKNLGLVVNYDPPSHLEDYVHRVGRTGRAGSEGKAVTFLTDKQTRSAADIARALRLSELPVPPEVLELATKFKPFRNRKTRAPGFGGHGLEKLDSERRAMREQALDGQDKDTSRGETPESTSIPAPIVKEGPSPGIKGPGTAKFHTSLEINDYPQEARLAVTSYSNQSQILDIFEVSITNRGTFYPPGKPGPDKLTLVIEGQTEASVAGAYSALGALLCEGIDRSSKSKKYSV